MLKKALNNKGLTLLEVIASIVIITIVLLSFSQIFIQTNKTAAYNNEKLVTINLADGILSKIRAKTYTKLPDGTSIENYFKETNPTITDKKLMDPPLEIEMNGKIYSVNYNASQHSNSESKYGNSIHTEKELNLIKVVVTVTSPDGKTKGLSEGYVSID